jgi:hypothetical protein
LRLTIPSQRLYRRTSRKNHEMRLKGRIVTGAILITVCLLQFPAVTALPYPSGAILGCGGDLCTSVSTWQLSSAFPVVQVTYLNQGNAQTTVLTLGEVKVANTNHCAVSRRKWNGLSRIIRIAKWPLQHHVLGNDHVRCASNITIRCP